MTADAGPDAGADVAPPDEICETPGDEDGDGAADCADPDCRDSETCAAVDYWIAYVVNDGALPRVALLSTAGGEPLALAADGAESLARDPGFGPDGDRVVVVYADPDLTSLRIVNVRDGGARDLPLEDVVRPGAPSFSPDGRRIAFTAVRRSDDLNLLRVVDVDSGELAFEWVADDASTGAVAPAWGQNGALFAIRTERTGSDIGASQGDLAQVDLDAGTVTAVTDGLRLSGRLRPVDGGFLVYSAALARLVWLPEDADGIRPASVEVVGAGDDVACAPIEGRLAVCSRSFAAPGDPQVNDLVLADWRTGDLVGRLTDTPSVSEGGGVSHPGTATLDRPVVP